MRHDNYSPEFIPRRDLPFSSHFFLISLVCDTQTWKIKDYSIEYPCCPTKKNDFHREPFREDDYQNELFSVNHEFTKKSIPPATSHEKIHFEYYRSPPFCPFDLRISSSRSTSATSFERPGSLPSAPMPIAAFLETTALFPAV